MPGPRWLLNLTVTFSTAALVAAWFAAAVALLHKWLWHLVGRNVIALSEQRLRVEKRVPLFGRTRECGLADIAGLRVVPGERAEHPLIRARRWLLVTPRPLAFDYGAATVRCGAAFTEAEAGQIVGRIGERFPRIVEPIGPTIRG